MRQLKQITIMGLELQFDCVFRCTLVITLTNGDYSVH